jgi:hypothetical protein
VNNLGQTGGRIEPADLCKCTSLDQGLEYRHDEKHVPIPDMPPEEVTIETIYSWPQNEPLSLDPPRSGVELQVLHVSGFIQEASVNSEDCDIHVENHITQYWIQKTNGNRFWATSEELKPM